MWSCKIFIEGYRSVLITYTDEIRAHSCDESLKFRERLKAIASNLFTWHASRFVRFGNWPPFIKYKLWRVCSNAFHIMHTCMLHAWSFEAAVWEILFRIKRLPDFQPSRASLNFCQVVTYSWMSLTVLPVAAVILCICVCVCMYPKRRISLPFELTCRKLSNRIEWILTQDREYSTVCE